MDISKLEVRHLMPSAGNAELAEKLVRDGWPELRKFYYGIREHMLAMEAMHQAAGMRLQAANARTTEARRAKANALLLYQMAGQEMPGEELATHDDEVRRCEESEAAATAELKAINDALGYAGYVFNMVNNTMADWSRGGVKVRQKKVKVRSGDRAEALKQVVAALRELLAETERTRNAPPTIPYLKQRLAEALDALQAEDAYSLEYAHGTPEWRHPVTAIEAEHVLPGRVVTTPNLLPLIIDLAGDDIRDRLMARIEQDHHGDTKLRLDPDEKQKRLKKLRAEILDLQREQAALIILLAGNKMELAFPPGMSVEAMLGVEVI